MRYNVAGSVLHGPRRRDQGFAVRVLHASGFETCQSCQGGAGHAYHEPTVEMVATSSDALGFGALEALHAYGLPVSGVAINWPVHNGMPFEKNWRITFSRTMENRADEKPIFIYGYRASDAVVSPVPWAKHDSV